MTLLGRALIQSDWCPIRGRDIKNEHTERQCEEDGILQAEERGLRRNQPCQHLDPELPASVRK